MASLLSSFSGWAWFDIVGTSLVALGCLGELWLLLRHSPTEPKELRVFESKKHFCEKIFVGMVAVGVSMELFSLPASLHETAKLVQQNIKLQQQMEETSNNVVKIDPLNLPVNSMLAQLVITLGDTNLVINQKLNPNAGVDAEIATFGGCLEVMDRAGVVLTRLACNKYDDRSVAVFPVNRKVISVVFNW